MDDDHDALLVRALRAVAAVTAATSSRQDSSCGSGRSIVSSPLFHALALECAKVTALEEQKEEHIVVVQGGKVFPVDKVVMGGHVFTLPNSVIEDAPSKKRSRVDGN